MKVLLALIQRHALDAIDHIREYLSHISEGLFTPRQTQIPSCVMIDSGRVIQRVYASNDWRSLPEMAQCPFLLKPRYMSDFPQWRVYYVNLRSEHLLVRQVRNKLERAISSLDQCVIQIVSRCHRDSQYAPLAVVLLKENNILRYTPAQ
jgi:hypothetical protein